MKILFSLLFLLLILACGRDERVVYQPQDPTVIYNRGHGHTHGPGCGHNNYRHRRPGYGGGPYGGHNPHGGHRLLSTGAYGSAHGMGTGTHRLTDGSISKETCEQFTGPEYYDCMNLFESNN